ncbi:unnamed protein product [Caenorhabditis angaria]|uniref:Uncharacterized protein n=1 Tax=Caenorhabditis angaria TaxID=860376 RepID=A0A9P1J0H7_9PELO|nr:unnamed protein product [Caenorhabditis angaria]
MGRKMCARDCGGKRAAARRRRNMPWPRDNIGFLLQYQVRLYFLRRQQEQIQQQQAARETNSSAQNQEEQSENDDQNKKEQKK